MTTKKDLKIAILWLNHVTGSPTERGVVGHHYSRYSHGHGVYRTEEGGGSKALFPLKRRFTKRQLVWLIHAYIDGYTRCQRKNGGE